MKYRIDGFSEGNDFYELGVELPLSTEQLSTIMDWQEPEDGYFVYTLTAEQLEAIVELSNISILPNLTYQLGPG